MQYPILIYLLIILISIIFLGGGCYCFYQYRLYQLVKFSEKWRPWKNSMIGIMLLESGIIFAVISLFTGVFLTYPDTFNVSDLYIPLFILMYSSLIAGSIGIWWAGLGLRAYWIEVLKISTEGTKNSNE